MRYEVRERPTTYIERNLILTSGEADRLLKYAKASDPWVTMERLKKSYLSISLNGMTILQGNVIVDDSEPSVGRDLGRIHIEKLDNGNFRVGSRDYVVEVDAQRLAGMMHEMKSIIGQITRFGIVDEEETKNAGRE